MLKRHRRARVIATLGPASSTKEMIEKLVDVGADVFRLNASHGTHEEMEMRYKLIREVEETTGRPIGVLLDLQGPKLRIGKMEKGVELVVGQHFRLDLDPTPGTLERAPLPHKEILSALKVGSTLLINDGKIRLEVCEASPQRVDTIVKVGGLLTDKKGVNVPDVVLPLDALTEKDRNDLEFGLKLGVDWIALSFVQRAADIVMVKEIVKGRAGVMAKIEKPSAVEDIESIVDQADAIMIARGDLGVEMPLEKVPGIQKRIIKICRIEGKPVVVATQMLESMIESPVPTRAEVSDVATAIYDGADAIMLSAESAAGHFPLEAVGVMDKVAREVEANSEFWEGSRERRCPPTTSYDAITAAARQVAETIDASAIVNYTSSGSTSIRTSRERPKTTIISLTPKIEVARKLALVWGVNIVVTRDAKAFKETVTDSTHIAQKEGYADIGDKIVITAGVPFGKPGTTNILRIATIGSDNSL